MPDTKYLFLIKAPAEADLQIHDPHQTIGIDLWGHFFIHDDSDLICNAPFIPIVHGESIL